MWVELVKFIGLVNNNTMVQGKAFLFKFVIKDTEPFEGILFVHETVKAFLTIDEDVKLSDVDKEQLIKHITEKYPLSDLLAFKE